MLHAATEVRYAGVTDRWNAEAAWGSLDSVAGDRRCDVKRRVPRLKVAVIADPSCGGPMGFSEHVIQTAAFVLSVEDIRIRRQGGWPRSKRMSSGTGQRQRAAVKVVVHLEI